MEKKHMGSHPKKEITPPEQGDDDASLWREIRHMLKSLQGLSREEWTESKRLLWSEYVKLRRNIEIKSLELIGVSEEIARKLAQFAWVRKCPESETLVVEKLPPENSSVYVPVVLVNRDGRFEIDRETRYYLDFHPILSLQNRQLSDQDAYAEVVRELEEVFRLEEEIGLGHEGLYYLGDSIMEFDGEDVRLANLGYSAHHLKHLLDPNFKAKDSNEDLGWLDLGKSGSRFWDLLSTAIRFGKAIAHRQFLDVLKGEDAIRRIDYAPPGKKTTADGEAIEEMIVSYTLEKGSVPKALQLLEWLRLERPYATGDPLKFDHSMWTGAKPNVTLLRFQQLVKDAKKRLKRRRYSPTLDGWT